MPDLPRPPDRVIEDAAIAQYEADCRRSRSPLFPVRGATVTGDRVTVYNSTDTLAIYDIFVKREGAVELRVPEVWFPPRRPENPT